MGHIYGIYADKKLIYIGKTTRDLETRFKEHRLGVKNKKQRIHSIIAEMLLQGKKVQMRGLYEVQNEKDLAVIENQLILKHQPIGNVQGSIINKRRDCKKTKGVFDF